MTAESIDFEGAVPSEEFVGLVVVFRALLKQPNGDVFKEEKTIEKGFVFQFEPIDENHVRLVYFPHDRGAQDTIDLVRDNFPIEIEERGEIPEALGKGELIRFFRIVQTTKE